jgi:CubicO group peptidase (beta-lactamase class C family)
MSIALIRGGKTVWLHGFGVKDKKTGEPSGCPGIRVAEMKQPG